MLGKICHTHDIMPNFTHLQRDHFPISAQRQGMSCEIQAPLQGFQRPLAQERGDIRVQDEGREHTLNAGRSHGDISGVTNFSSPAITKFERRMGLIGGHSGETAARRKFIMAA